ncbi:hypothetical protein CGZ93_12715 [Enemella dayhoffiae]|uniref:Uncharacterized protein n=1 Tax=Enemella dayhoffiae TaxID=2016507 RepID=A0A255GU79_9ACTN|nr:hypothetical protein [Enemella dayhoffiae]OYO19245.1 hypothetical protein CGZ93_12715 [Enemella dayhoffiae]
MSGYEPRGWPEGGGQQGNHNWGTPAGGPPTDAFGYPLGGQGPSGPDPWGHPGPGPQPDPWGGHPGQPQQPQPQQPQPQQPEPEQQIRSTAVGSSDRQARIERRNRRRALRLEHDRELREAPRPARTAITAWLCGVLFAGLIFLMLQQGGGPVNPQPGQDLTVSVLGTGLAVAIGVSGAVMIWRWRQRHPPQTVIYQRQILSTGQGTSSWDPRGTWVATDPLLGVALLFGSLPVGVFALPYYTIAGLLSPITAVRRLRRHYRERKAI